VDAPKSKSFLLLFTDQLVIVKRLTDRNFELSGIGKKGKNMYHKTYRFSDAQPISLSDLQADATALPESLGFGFEFSSLKSPYWVFVKTLDERKNWVREINKARKAFELSSSEMK